MRRRDQPKTCTTPHVCSTWNIHWERLYWENTINWWASHGYVNRSTAVENMHHRGLHSVPGCTQDHWHLDIKHQLVPCPPKNSSMNHANSKQGARINVFWTPAQSTLTNTARDRTVWSKNLTSFRWMLRLVTLQFQSWSLLCTSRWVYPTALSI